MNDVNGINLPDLPIKLEIYVGILFYHEFPSTVIYSNSNNEIIIKEWIDCEGEINRYYIYEIDATNLKQFIEGKISHYDLYLLEKNGIGFLVDEMNGKYENITIISADKLPDDYLPSYDLFFVEENGVETEKIIRYFDLENVKNENENLDEFLTKLSKERKSEIFNIHYKKGKSVGFGRIETQAFGRTIIAFDELYKEVGFDFYYGRDRGDKNDKDDKVSVLSTEFFFKKAASFSAYIKPKYAPQLSLFGETDSEKISSNIFTLFKNTSTQEKILENYEKHSDFVFRAYKHFLKEASYFDVDLQINWIDADAEKIWKQDFNLFTANKIINNIDKLNTLKTLEIKTKGRFRAINCKTAHFTFISNDEEEFTGYFERLLHEGIYFLNFTNLYEVLIERKVTKEPGQVKDKIKDTLISYSEMEQ